jgi:large subunit ribosomal protein L15
MPLVRRVPKRGFNNRFALTVHAINVADLQERFEDGADVTLETLREKSLAKGRYDVLKILGDGELTKKLNVSAHRFSVSAREKIEKAGGQVTVLDAKKADSGKPEKE